MYQVRRGGQNDGALRLNSRAALHQMSGTLVARVSRLAA
jgi:hypothetical protein